jgi:hypothetical protein
MCVDCVLASPRIAQVDLGDEPLPEVVLSQCCLLSSFEPRAALGPINKECMNVHI